MKHLTQVVIYMDIGGNKAHEDNPQPLTVVRSVDDFEQIAVNIQLPAVEQDMMVILRVESHKVSDRCFLSVTNDPGIDLEPVWDIYPDQKILSGTSMHLKISQPEQMDDFNNASEIIIENPTGSHHIEHFSMNTQSHSITAITGDTLSITSVLMDRSGNRQVNHRSISIIPYFDHHNEMLFSCEQDEQLLADIIILPKLNQKLHCLFFAVNSLTGGYDIRYPDGLFYSKPTGELSHLSFTGTGILAVEKNGQTNNILFWPINGEISDTPVTYNLTGKLIGSAGNTIFLQHGALFDAIHYDSKFFISIAGKIVSSPVTMARVDCGRLYILTENALHAFQTNESLSLTQVFMTHMGQQCGWFFSQQ
ncbi:fibronectin type III domain protein [Candidatus Magnetomorum sp. HK-1]|nr:fibronectin type III domain protein [Candidatus Magnetomorum sp. HK-1]